MVAAPTVTAICLMQQSQDVEQLIRDVFLPRHLTTVLQRDIIALTLRLERFAGMAE